MLEVSSRNSYSCHFSVSRWIDASRNHGNNILIASNMTSRCQISSNITTDAGARLVRQKAYFAELEGINKKIWQCCICSAK